MIKKFFYPTILILSVFSVFHVEAGYETNQILHPQDPPPQGDFGAQIEGGYDRLLISSPGLDISSSSGNSLEGKIDVFKKSSGTWVLEQSLTINNSIHPYVSKLGERMGANDYGIAAQYRHDLYSFSVALFDWNDLANFSVVSNDDEFSSFGHQSLFIDADSVLISAPQEAGGTVYLFKRSGGEWAQVQRIELADLVDSLEPSDRDSWYLFPSNGFGYDIDSNNGEIAISCPTRNLVFLFDIHPDNISLKQTIDLTNGYPGKNAGTSISFNENLLFISAPLEEARPRCMGLIYCYQKTPNGDYEFVQKFSSDFPGQIGTQIASSGDYLASAMDDETDVVLFKLNDEGFWDCHGIIQTQPTELVRVDYVDLFWNGGETGNLICSAGGYFRTPTLTWVEACRDINLEGFLSMTPPELSVTPLSHKLGNELSWTPTPGASRYEIFRSQGDSLQSATVIHSTGNTSYTDQSGLVRNRESYYRILSRFENGTLSGSSSSASNWDGINAYRISSTQPLRVDTPIHDAALSSDGTLFAAGQCIFKTTDGIHWEKFQSLQNENYFSFSRKDFSPSDEWMVAANSSQCRLYKRNEDGYYELKQTIPVNSYDGVALSGGTLFAAGGANISVYRLNTSDQWELSTVFTRPFTNVSTNSASSHLKFAGNELAILVDVDPNSYDSDFGTQGLYFYTKTSAGNWEKTDEILVEKVLADFDWDGTRAALVSNKGTSPADFFRIYKRTDFGEWKIEEDIVPHNLQEWPETGSDVNGVLIKDNKMMFSSGGDEVYFYILDADYQWSQQARIPVNPDPNPSLGFIHDNGLAFQESAIREVTFVEIVSQTPLQIPSNLGVRVGATHPTLFWDDIEDPFGFSYEIMAGRRPQPEAGYLSNTINGNSYPLGSSSGQSTYLRVRAKSADNSRYSQWSDVEVFTTLPPSMPAYIEQSAPHDPKTRVYAKSPLQCSLTEVEGDSYVGVSHLALEEDDRSQVRIYRRSLNSAEWEVHQIIDEGMPAGGSGIESLASIELSERYLFIGSSSGVVDIYERDSASGIWEFEMSIESPDLDGKFLYGFAASLAWNSPFLLISAPDSSEDGGEVLVYEEDSDGNFNLHQVVDFDGDFNHSDDFARFMKFDGDYLVVFQGSYKEPWFEYGYGEIYVAEMNSGNMFSDFVAFPVDNPGIDFELHGGEVYIINKDSKTVDIYENIPELGWSHQQLISLPDLDSFTNDQNSFNRYSVSVSGRIMCLSASFDNTDETGAGGVFLYFRNDEGIWTFAGRISDFSPTTDGRFGIITELERNFGVVLSYPGYRDKRMGEDLIHFLSISNWAKDLNEDENANGLPDSWEERFSISGSGFDLSHDSDGDGLSLREESLLKTDPFNRDSGVELNRSVVGGYPLLSLGNHSGVGNFILMFSVSPSGPWREVKRWINPAPNRVAEFIDTANVGDEGFYKVAFEPVHGPDLDGNGLGDLWEMEFFGRTGVDPNDDPDQDGLPNIVESKLNYNPIRYDESIKLQIAPHQGDVILSVSEVKPEYVYVLEFKENLNAPDWIEILRWDSPIIISDVSAQYAIASQTGFFRIRVLER